MKTLKISSSKKDILSIADLSTNEIDVILMLAEKLKHEQKRGKSRPFLRGKMLGMIFQKPSTRTRVSFEVGMFQLGGDAVYLGANDIQLSRGETIEDTAKTLSLYLDCIMARVYNHKDVQTLARYASVPVIKGLQLAWLGDGNNICNDLMIGCAKTGINMNAACPSGYEPLEEIVELAKAEAKKTGVDITITN